MKSTALLVIALTLGLFVAMWVSSLWLYDREKMDDALAQRQALLLGDTPYRWSFDSPTELGVAHDPGRFHWSGGRLQGALDDPYFYLNLEGRWIDARRYTVLELRLHAGSAGQRQLFHEQPGDPEIHASNPVAVAAGWQTLELDLAATEWSTRDTARAEPAYRASAWGGETGVVSALRIDPVRDGAFEMDWVKLKMPGTPSPELSGVHTFRAPDDPLFGRMRADPGRIWLIAQDRRARTPETAHLARMKIAGEFPSAVLFPRPPSDRELSGGPRGPEPAPGALPALAYVLALLTLVAGRRVPASWRPLLETAALVCAIEAALFWAPHLPGSARWLPGLPLLAIAWVWRPVSWRRVLLGDARAWLWVAPLIGIAGVLILSFGGRSADVATPQVVFTYLAWALLQQYVVAVLIRGRLEPGFGPLSSVLAAGAFGFLHLPNFALMCATFLLGLFLMEVYRRYRNLPAIACVHALLAVGVNLAAPHLLWLSRQVGPAFLAGL